MTIVACDDLQTPLRKFGDKPNRDNAATRNRAEELVEIGFVIAYAAHEAYAEASGAAMITCNVRLLKLCKKHGICVQRILRGTSDARI